MSNLHNMRVTRNWCGLLLINTFKLAGLTDIRARIEERRMDVLIEQFSFISFAHELKHGSRVVTFKIVYYHRQNVSLFTYSISK